MSQTYRRESLGGVRLFQFFFGGVTGGGALAASHRGHKGRSFDGMHHDLGDGQCVKGIHETQN